MKIYGDMNRSEFDGHQVALQNACQEVSISGKRFTEELKIQAVEQVTEQGHSIPEVAKLLGPTAKSLYDWLREPASKHIPEHGYKPKAHYPGGDPATVAIEV